MLVRYAIMGLLERGEMHGYRLKSAFEERLGPVWTINFGQIYQVLKDLKRRGLVEARFDSGRHHMGRWMYKLTARGRRSLQTWVQRSPRLPAPVRDELFIRLLALVDKSPKPALEHITRETIACRERVAELISSRDAVQDLSDETALLRSVAIEAALAHARAHLDWLHHCAEVFSLRS